MFSQLYGLQGGQNRGERSGRGRNLVVAQAPEVTQDSPVGRHFSLAAQTAFDVVAGPGTGAVLACGDAGQVGRRQPAVGRAEPNNLS
jgi:hypothetical protein